MFLLKRVDGMMRAAGLQAATGRTSELVLRHFQGGQVPKNGISGNWPLNNPSRIPPKTFLQRKR